MTDKTIRDFLSELKSESPTPGGGGVAALNSANGVALVMMVANLTVSVEKYADWHQLCKDVLVEAEELLAELTAGINRDAEEFGKVIAAYGLPHSTDEEKAARSKAIGEASITAAEAPLQVMEGSVKGMELVKKILGKSNPNVESDLYVATLSLYSGLLSAQYNVNANLGGIKKVNPEYAEELAAKSEELIDAGRVLSEEILA